MPQKPTDDSIKFLTTKVIDNFPTIVDRGDTTYNDPIYYTAYAEYYNKVRRFIGQVEPLCTKNTAIDPTNSMNSIASWYLGSYSLNELIKFCVGDNPIIPPSQVLPFEIVITSASGDNYGYLEANGSGRFLFLDGRNGVNLNKFLAGRSPFYYHPFVRCTLSRGTSVDRYAVTSYCVPGTETLLIRGSIIDLANSNAYDLGPYPPPNADGHFYGNTTLSITLIGVS